MSISRGDIMDVATTGAVIGVIQATDYSRATRSVHRFLPVALYFALTVCLMAATSAASARQEGIAMPRGEIVRTALLPSSPMLAAKTASLDGANQAEENGSQHSARAFCSTVDGTTDNTHCVQAAVDKVCDDGGGILAFPPGRYVIATIVIPCSGVELVGEGRGDRDQNAHATTILPLARAGAAPVFLFHVATFRGIAGRAAAPSCCAAYSYGGVVRGFAFIATDARTGPMVRMEDVQGGLVDNNYFWNVHTAVSFYGGVQNRFTNFYGDQFVDNGEFFTCGGTDEQDQEGHFIHRQDVCKADHGYMAQVNAATRGACIGIHDFVNTVQLENIECETSSYALRVDCASLHTAENCPAFFTLYDFEAEAFGPTVRDLVSLRDVHEFRFIAGVLDGGPTGVTGINNLVSFRPGRFQRATVLVVANSKIKHARGACIYATGSQVIVQGNHISGCGAFASSGTYAGVEIGTEGANPRGDGIVTGNVFCIDEGNNSASSSRMRAAWIRSPSHGNVLLGNSTHHCPEAMRDDNMDMSDHDDVFGPNAGH